MTGTITFSQDATRLTQQVSTLKAWLLGTGATDGQCKDMLKTEAGLLAWEIAKQIPPESKEAGSKKVEKDVKSVFFPLTAKHQFSGRQIGTQTDWLWLFAYGPGNRDNETRAFPSLLPSFLVGAKADDIQLTYGPDLLEMFYKKENRMRGAKWLDLGTWTHSDIKNKRRHYSKFRANQHALRINRIVITPQAFAAVKKQILEKLGQLKATFALTASKLATRKPIPAWVSRHFSDMESSGKSIFNDAGLSHPTEPWIEFGSHAKGVESNPLVRDRIHAAFVKRSFALAKKVKDLASGATYVWNTGQTYFPKTGGDE